MKSFEIPSAPGLVVGSDFFDCGSDQYIIFVDLFSAWIEFFKVNTKDAKNLIQALRVYMTRNGIPRVFTSDQGSAYTSKEFNDFCVKMGIKRVDGSAKHERGNAHAEAAVKKVKKLLGRCRSEDELVTAILAWHQTEMTPGRATPAQIHLGRNLRDELHWNVQQACVQWKDVRDWKEKKQELTKKNFDKGTRELSLLDEGQNVFVQIDDSWKEAKIVKKLDRPRSYQIETENGKILERNRVKLKPNETVHSKNPRKTISFRNSALLQGARNGVENGRNSVPWPRLGRDDDLSGSQERDDPESGQAEHPGHDLDERPTPEPEEAGESQRSENTEENDFGTDQRLREQHAEGPSDDEEDEHELGRPRRNKKKVRRLIEEM
jgi:hypothetical protein